MFRSLKKRFIERNKTTDCEKLLGVDLINGDKAIAKQMVTKVCPIMVKDAAEILEAILETA